MTTIAYDGRYLAADTLMVRGGNRSEQPLCKLVARDGFAYAFGGQWWAIAKELIARGRRLPDPKGLEGVMVTVQASSRQASVITSDVPYPDLEAAPIGFGTGGDIALGAMGAGLTAMEAVAIAARWDLKTGGRIDFIDLEHIDKGVQRWDDVMLSAKFPMPVNVPLEADEPVDTFTFDASVDLTDWKDDGTTGTMEFETVEIPKPKVRAGAFVCRGSYMLGTACRQCERCVAEWQRMQKRGQDDDFAVLLLPKGYELKRGLLPAAHGHRNGVIGRAEMCDHGYVRATCATCG